MNTKIISLLKLTHIYYAYINILVGCCQWEKSLTGTPVDLHHRQPRDHHRKYSGNGHIAIYSYDLRYLCTG